MNTEVTLLAKNSNSNVAPHIMYVSTGLLKSTIKFGSNDKIHID